MGKNGIISKQHFTVQIKSRQIESEKRCRYILRWILFTSRGPIMQHWHWLFYKVRCGSNFGRDFYGTISDKKKTHTWRTMRRSFFEIQNVLSSIFYSKALFHFIYMIWRAEYALLHKRSVFTADLMHHSLPLSLLAVVHCCTHIPQF